MWSNHRRSSAVSSGSFQTMNGPGYSGLGEYSKSSTSAPTTSRLMIR